MAAMTAVVPGAVSPVPPAVKLTADSTALLVCGTTCPTWNDAGIEAIMDRFVAPTHPGHTITPVAVTTPGESWPLTGIFRVLGLLLGDPSIFGPGGPAWPDEPWWKLSGLFDLTGDQSIEAGAAGLEEAMAAHPDEDLVIYGLSQGAASANVVKNRLAAQYPEDAAAPNIDFVFQGDASVPNGGLHARFPGLYIPILDWTFNGPAPTDTQFDTVIISTQYDGFADFPLYPINLVADLNAILGILYLHTRPFDVSLPADPTTSPAYRGTYGDSSYYFFETDDLPLFAPLRMLGVPEPVIDVVEPFFRVLVELGYDRSIPLWEPTPARLIPKLDAATVFADLGDAIEEGVDNALALVGLSPTPKAPSVGIEAVPAEDVETQVVNAEVGDFEAAEPSEAAPTIDQVDDITVETEEPTDGIDGEGEPTEDEIPASDLEGTAPDGTEAAGEEDAGSTVSEGSPSAQESPSEAEGDPPAGDATGRNSESSD
ncbi:hypothetical protein A4X20_21050 [Mycolicibacterium iranicum]|uniref:PE-PPE domain-containing protein n=1 Tax=Mycolicibacterium iranicum TaxID=912594 RepID=A0A178LUM0_MYCIR|nr:hypothetical protein A4X20_21050 [Mycolicibacterium iranicum]